MTKMLPYQKTLPKADAQKPCHEGVKNTLYSRNLSLDTSVILSILHLPQLRAAPTATKPSTSSASQRRNPAMLVRSVVLSVILTAVGIATALYCPESWTIITIAAVFPIRFAFFWWAGCRARRAATIEIFNIKEKVLKEEQRRRHPA